MSEEKIAEEATILVLKTMHKKGKELSKDEDLQVKVKLFATQPAQIKYSIGGTVNIGNFESVRVDVSISVPCYREEIDEVFEASRDWADKRLNTELKKAQALKTDPAKDF